MSARVSTKAGRLGACAAPFVAAVGSALTILALTAGPAAAATTKVRIGTPPPVPAGATAVAASAKAVSKPMEISVALKPRHAARLAKSAAAVTEPNSSQFRAYVTAKQFRAGYAPTAATVKKVEADLRRSGLILRGTTANHLAIRVAGTGDAIEHAFSLRFVRLRLADGKDVEVNAEAPAVARTIAPEIESVVGLNGMETMRAEGRAREKTGARPQLTSEKTIPVYKAQPKTGGPRACKAAVKAEDGSDENSRGAYTANQIASHYDFGGLYRRGDKGQGVTVALYELEFNSKQDIQAYKKCYGTNTDVSYVAVDGGPGKRAKKKNPDGSGEAALDIQQLIGLAPKIHLLVYQGPNSSGNGPGSGPYDVFAKIIGQDRAAVVSSSWGQCEAVETYRDAVSERTLFEEAALQGQSITSAAGDSGSEDCYDVTQDGTTTLAVDDPASDPWVTGVGGTTLDLSADPAREVVWNNTVEAENGFGGAGGGGVSDFWEMPNYQKDAPTALHLISGDPPTLFNSEQGTGSYTNGCTASSGYCREVPDVSASADPLYGYLNYFNGNGDVADAPEGWQAVGGTSAASPLWAALFALADGDSACHSTRIGFANPALYRLAGESHDTYFTDITSGTNDYTGEGGQFSAATGYDMASGLGSPKASVLAPALCGQTLMMSGSKSRSAKVGTKVHVKIDAKRPRSGTFAGKVVFHAHGLPSGLKLNTSTGVISGKLKLAEVKHVTVSAHLTGSTPATAYGALGFTWTVVKPKPKKKK